jgi:hypothetical protein
VRRFTDRMSVRNFEAETFSTAHWDFLLIETDDLKAYSFFSEDLRDSDFTARGWVRLHDITFGVPDGYMEYEKGIA